MSAPEPELVSLWRDIVKRRESLARAVERWTAPGLPELELLCELGCRTPEATRDRASRMRTACVVQLGQLDRTLRTAARAEARDGGLTLRQLRALASPEWESEVRGARVHLAEWLRLRVEATRDPVATGLRQLHALIAEHYLDGLGCRASLSQLDDEDRAWRKERAAAGRERASRAPQRTAARIIARVVSRTSGHEGEQAWGRGC